MPDAQRPTPDKEPASRQNGSGGLWRGIGHSVSGQLIYLLTQSGVMIALAHMRGIESVGHLGLALGIATPVFMLAHFGLRTGIATEDPDSRSFDDYLRLAVIGAGLGAVASFAIGYALNGDMSVLLACVIAMKMAESISKLCHGAFQRAGRMDWVSGSLILRGGLTLVFFVLSLWAGMPTDLAFVVQALVWTGLLVGFDLPRARRAESGSTAPRRPLWPLVKDNLPLALSACLIALMIALPRFFLDSLMGLAAVGIYTAVSQIYQAGSMVVDAVNQAILSQFASWRRAKRSGATHSPLGRTVTLLLTAATVASVGGIAVVVLAGEPILRIAFGAETADQGRALLLIMSLALVARVYSVVPQGIIQADRRFWTYFTLQATSLVLMAAILPVAIGARALDGAGMAMLIVAGYRLLFACLSAIRSGRKGGPA